MSKLKEWFRRPRRCPDGGTPGRGWESLKAIRGRHQQAHDLLRASLEMLIAARRSEAEAEAESRKAEKNGAVNGCQ